MLTDNTEIDIEALIRFAKARSQEEHRVIYLGGAKLKPLENWGDFREVPYTEKEIDDYFDNTTNRVKTLALAIALRSKAGSAIAFDIDRKDAQEVFFDEFMPTLPEEVQKDIMKVPRTGTKSGGLHFFLPLDKDSAGIIILKEECPEITIEGKGGDTKHSQINILGTEFMLRECGKGYSTIIGYDSNNIRFSKSTIDLILQKAKDFKHATQMIRIAGNVLKPLWDSPNRDKLAMYGSGLLGKGQVPQALTERFFNHIMRVTALSDEDKEHTLKVIERTYSKIFRNERVEGYEGLMKIDGMKQAMIDEIQTCFKQLGYFPDYHNGHSSTSTSTDTAAGATVDPIFQMPPETRVKLNENIWAITSYYPQIVVIANKQLNKTVEAKIYTKTTTTKSGMIIEAGSIIINKVYINAIPIEITKHEDPLSESMMLPEHKYTIKFKVAATGQTFTNHEPSSLDSIMADLGNRALIASEFGAKNALMNLINEFQNRGLIKIDREIQTPGFFLVNGKLSVYRLTFPEHSIDELREACVFLNNLVSKHYRAQIPVTTIKWGMIAPFDFALKQYTNDICWLPWLAFTGFPRSGKGTQGRIASGIWSDYGSNKYYIPFTSVNTEARLAKKLSLDTLPFTINETDDLNGEHMKNMVEMFKTSIETRISRSTYRSRASYVDELALRAGVLTSNPDFPNEIGFRSRVIRIVYTKEDKYWNETERVAFDAFMIKGKKHLRTLGDFTANYILNNPTFLLKKNPEECNWKETAKQILEAFYASAKYQIPYWLNLFVEETDVTAVAAQDAAEANYFELRGFFISWINESFRLDPLKDSTDRPTACTLPEKLDHCLRRNLIPFLRRRVNQDKEGHNTGNEIVITHDIVRELKKAKIVNISTMKALAQEIKSFKYDFVWMNEASMRAVFGPENDFTKFLNSEFKGPPKEPEKKGGDTPQNLCEDVRS